MEQTGWGLELLCIFWCLLILYSANSQLGERQRSPPQHELSYQEQWVGFQRSRGISWWRTLHPFHDMDGESVSRNLYKLNGIKMLRSFDTISRFTPKGVRLERFARYAEGLLFEGLLFIPVATLPALPPKHKGRYSEEGAGKTARHKDNGGAAFENVIMCAWFTIMNLPADYFSAVNIHYHV